MFVDLQPDIEWTYTALYLSIRPFFSRTLFSHVPPFFFMPSSLRHFCSHQTTSRWQINGGPIVGSTFIPFAVPPVQLQMLLSISNRGPGAATAAASRFNLLSPTWGTSCASTFLLLLFPWLTASLCYAIALFTPQHTVTHPLNLSTGMFARSSALARSSPHAKT